MSRCWALGPVLERKWRCQWMGCPDKVTIIVGWEYLVNKWGVHMVLRGREGDLSCVVRG